MRPYVICHMMPSVDGRLRTERWPIPKKARAEYERTGASHRADAWLCGTTTMEEFAIGRARARRAGRRKLPRTDLVFPRERGASYAVAIDAHGRLDWKAAEIEGDPLVLVLAENVPDAHLHRLQELGISYLFAGKNREDFDLRVALEKLRRACGVKKLLVEGGGAINGSLLRAGLIDELSLLITPVADGQPGEPALFDVEGEETKRAVAALSLKSVRRIAGDMVWLRYRVKHRGRR